MKKIKRLLPHATLILSLMVLTFFVIDRFNEYMAFMSSEISKWVIAGLALCALLSAIRLILMDQTEPQSTREVHSSKQED